ncbi:chromate efflux transporter [Hymenobacter lutimineralis]|uniref:Chromate efflux transporter n=1 Tax=Hymenobacter lutimineralis TaxID=2606448 RepID=A0A5D6V2M6_9BACT|nr:MULTISPECIES: chromate efflux transporter [Hymenobacter]QIX61700.1 chromate efflux transporter [Hymenobacter sp. BT18]TYZ09242.1 chromate efflux transporter [Hymenobacter lutimineralis]
MQQVLIPVSKPTFAEALRFWLKLGFISFGGPAGQIGIMHTVLVEEKRWISDAKFLHALNYCMLLPGPEAQQLATYIGWLLHGTRGGLAAGILFVLPSVFILLALSLLYVTVGTLPALQGVFLGLKPAVVAVILLAMMKIGQKSLLSPLHYAVAAASFLGIFWLNIPFPLLIIGAAVVALLAQRFFPVRPSSEAAHARATQAEEGYFLTTRSMVPGTGFAWPRLLRQLGAALGLWALPLGVLAGTTPDFSFWRMLTLFFTQAALVTFGGAYAVLPYVAQVSVEKLHWLTQSQMLDGLALGETTPGPLIMVLAFVGFMGGYTHFGGSLAFGALGLLTTTYYTFLPCFVFILVGAPLIERTQHNPQLKAVLSIITAAVVGVILNLAVYLGRSVLFPAGPLHWSQLHWPSLVWVLVSLVGLYRFKLNLILWIGISAVAGLLYYFAQAGH